MLNLNYRRPLMLDLYDQFPSRMNEACVVCDRQVVKKGDGAENALLYLQRVLPVIFIGSQCEDES